MSEQGEEQPKSLGPESGQLPIPREVQETIREIARQASPAAGPQKLEQELLSIFTKLTISYSRRGPLPHPSELAEYEKVLPGSAERILAASERQAAHRMRLETSTVAKQMEQSGKGQIFGFIIALCGLAASSGVILAGHSVSGAILGSVDLVSLVAVFVLGKYEMRGRLAKKAKAVHPPK